MESNLSKANARLDVLKSQHFSFVFWSWFIFNVL